MSRRLLLVEDDDSIRQIARLSLARVGGWTVLETSSGREAIALAPTAAPLDAVLLDVMMPGLDGPSTMRALRAGPLGAGVPFVFLTAKLQAADRARLEGLGAAGVIAKPFDPIGLSAQLDRLLAGDPEPAEPGEGEPRVDAEFSEIWSRRRAAIEARAETIASALADLAAGEPPPGRRDEAIAAAHMLSGSLGTFGLHRGGELARCLESGLRAGEPPARLRVLSAELTRVLAGAAAPPRRHSGGATGLTLENRT